jgi:hypothetical protein
LTANFATTLLCGVVEIDGGWFGGHVRPENHRLARVDRRRRQNRVPVALRRMSVQAPSLL